MLIDHKSISMAEEKYLDYERVHNLTTCISYDKGIFSRGIFMSPEFVYPFGYLYPGFLAQLIMILIMSNLVYYALRPCVRSKFACNVLTGIILGPSVLGRVNKYMETVFPDKGMLLIDTLARFGVGFFIFITAIKFDIAMLLRAGRNIWAVSITSFISPLIFCLCYGYMFQKRFTGLFSRPAIPNISEALALTFFISVADAMRDHKLVTTELGHLAMCSAMITELLSWVILIISYILQVENIRYAIGLVILVCGLSLFGTYVVRPVIISRVVKRTPAESPVSESDVVAILALSLILGFVTESMLGKVYIGNFVAGLCVPEASPLGAALIEKAETLLLSFFMPLFFLIIGYHVDLALMSQIDAVGLVVIFIVGSHLAKTLGTMLASLLLRVNFRNAFLLGIILNFQGIMDFTIYERWLAQGVVDKRMYTATVVINLLLTCLHGNLIYLFYKPQTRLAKYPSKRFKALQSTSVSGPLNVLACIYSEDNVCSIISVLEASNPDATCPISVYVIHAIELTGGVLSRLTPYNNYWRRKYQYRNASSRHIMHAFMDYTKHSRGPVYVRPFTLLAPYKTMHSILCNIAEDRNLPFIIVPFLRNDLEADGAVKKRLVRDFNTQIQAHALCTVGILVHKGTCCLRDIRNFSYSVLVIFVGGDDDREALALASRMTRNSDVSITLLRMILEKGNEDIDEAENTLDDSLIEEFKENNLENDCVDCCEVEVGDSSDLISVVGCLKDKFDLAIVGKMPNKMKFMEEIQGWVEYQELGVIGDLIFSSESQMSVLVMQHSLKAD